MKKPHPDENEMRRLEREADEYQQTVEESAEELQARYYAWKQQMIRLNKVDQTIIQLHSVIEKNKPYRQSIAELAMKHIWKISTAVLLIFALILMTSTNRNGGQSPQPTSAQGR